MHAPSAHTHTMHALAPQVPNLADDLGEPPGVPPRADRRAWLGPAHTVTPIHYDHHHGLLVQIVGRKRLLLWPPSAGALLRAPPEASGLANTSPVDPCATAMEERAALRDGCITVLLEAGDACLIPMGWWHHACSLTVSFSVSWWWDA